MGRCPPLNVSTSSRPPLVLVVDDKNSFWLLAYIISSPSPSTLQLQLATSTPLPTLPTTLYPLPTSPHRRADPITSHRRTNRHTHRRPISPVGATSSSHQIQKLTTPLFNSQLQLFRGTLTSRKPTLKALLCPVKPKNGSWIFLF